MGFYALDTVVLHSPPLSLPAVTWVQLIHIGLALLQVIWLVGPLARWATTRYAVTDQRTIVQSGVGTRRTHQVSFERVTSASSEQTMTDRMFNCATFVMYDAGAATSTGVRLEHIGMANEVHALLDELVRDDQKSQDGAR